MEKMRGQKSTQVRLSTWQPNTHTCGFFRNKIESDKSQQMKSQSWKVKCATPSVCYSLGGFSALISSRWAHVGIYGLPPAAACCCVTQPACFTVTHKSEIDGKDGADAATPGETIPLVQVAAPQHHFCSLSAWFSPVMKSTTKVRWGKLSPVRKLLIRRRNNV